MQQSECDREAGVMNKASKKNKVSAMSDASEASAMREVSALVNRVHPSKCN